MQCLCINAVRLHPLAEPVKTDRRARRRAETERRLVDAATALFVARGYAATTLADVAHSGVERTPVGWVLLGVEDPDGHAVRFYTVPLELPSEELLQAYQGEHRVHR